MKLRFVVGYQIDTGKRTTKPTTLMDRTGKARITNAPGSRIFASREDIFDDDCVLKFDVATLNRGISTNDASKQADWLPPDMEAELASVLPDYTVYVHRLRLVYPGRTLAFNWWNTQKQSDALLPDCFYVPLPSGHDFPQPPPWKTGSARGWLCMNDGAVKIDAFAINRVNSTIEAAEIERTVHAPTTLPLTTAADTKRKRAARRNGKKGGPKPRISKVQRNVAVLAIRKRMKDNPSLKLLPACRFYLKETPLPIGAERLTQLVRATSRRPSGKN